MSGCGGRAERWGGMPEPSSGFPSFPRNVDSLAAPHSPHTHPQHLQGSPKLILMELVHTCQIMLTAGKGRTKCPSVSCIEEAQGSELQPGGGRFKIKLGAEEGEDASPGWPEAGGAFVRTAPSPAA